MDPDPHRDREAPRRRAGHPHERDRGPGGQDALRRRGIGAEELDLIIVATVTPDMLFPATACLVQDQIGAKKAWGFDVSAACSGFVYALTVGAQFVETGRHKKVMVIGADVMTSILDYKDRTTCILFGDAAGAVILEPREDGTGILDFSHEVDGSGARYLSMPGGGSLHPATHETVDQKMHYIKQQGQHVFKYAVRKFADASEQILLRNDFTGTDVDLFVAHQANIRIIEAAQHRMGLPDPRWSRTSTSTATRRRPPSRSRSRRRSTRRGSRRGTWCSSPRSGRASPSARCCCAGPG